MNYLKLTLILCFFSTFLSAQEEYPGYIVKLDGDTIRGRIVVQPDKIKFKEDGVKTFYKRNELKDYGYYANKLFYSRPDIIAPTKEAKTLGFIVLTEGDTLRDFHIHTIRPNVIIGYFEYPKYVAYKASDGDLSEICVHRKEEDAFIDLMQVNDYPKKGDIYPMYAERKFEIGLKAYNVNSRRPYQKVYNRTTLSTMTEFLIDPLVANALLKILTEPEIAKAKASPDHWIIYKNDEIYNIHNIFQWKKIFDTIFQESEEFKVYLKENKVSLVNISKTLRAYGYFQKQNQ